MGLARAGTLRDALEAQAERMVADTRFAEALTEFFVDYLKIEAIFDKRKLESLGLTPEVRAAMVEGMRRDLMSIFARQDASLLDPFSAETFHVNATSASFFGVPVSSEAFELVQLDATERMGVLTHPGFLTVHAGEGQSGIVKRGVFTLEQLLCVELGAPPDDVGPVDEPPAGFDPDKASGREALVVLHSSQPACVGCHRVIDPAGFGFENFDAAGRYRTTEKDNIAIDASGVLEVHGETMTFSDSVSYIDALVNSTSLKSCLAENYLRYVLGDTPKALEREAFVEVFLSHQGDARALARAIVRTPSFVTRLVPEESGR